MLTNFKYFAFICTVILLCIFMASCASHKKQLVLKETQQKPKQKLLIKHGWDMPSLDWLMTNQSKIEDSPFDGVIFDSKIRGKIFSKESLLPSEIKIELQKYKEAGLSGDRSDFIFVLASHPKSKHIPPPILEDWSSVENNIRLLARHAKDAGFLGIAFDNEPYDYNWFGYDKELKERASFDECVLLYKQRGQRIAEILEEEWPDMSLLMFLGAWMSSNADSSYREPFPFLGAFFAGILKGAKTINVIDGGEQYWLSRKEDFLKAYKKIKYEYPKSYPFINAVDLEKWPEIIEVAFGVYDYQWGVESPQPLTVDELREKLTNAFYATDRFVWLYTEYYDWWIDRQHSRMKLVPKAYLEMVKEFTEQH